MSDWDLTPDHQHAERIGFDAATFSAGKSVDHIRRLLEGPASANQTLLLTRLEPDKLEAVSSELRESLDYDEVSRSAFSGRAVS